jgi:hypothetical protein
MSTRLQRFRTMAVTLFALALTVLNLLREETFAMADPLVQLGWEWRAERPLEQRVGLRLVKIEKEGGGLFGLGRSPSLGGSLPDAQRVQADVLAIDHPGQAVVGGKIAFRIPKVELRGASEGALVAVGIIGRSVVCLAPAPAEVTEDLLAGWLSEAPCP